MNRQQRRKEKRGKPLNKKCPTVLIFGAGQHKGLAPIGYGFAPGFPTEEYPVTDGLVVLYPDNDLDSPEGWITKLQGEGIFISPDPEVAAQMEALAKREILASVQQERVGKVIDELTALIRKLSFE